MKIFAVGNDYDCYNKEAEEALYKRMEPVIYTKADSALLKDHKPFFVPDWCSLVDCGAEIVVRICRLGKSIPERFAHRYYDALTVGVGFTARDVLRRLRDGGLPWELAKGFDGSAVIGEWVDKAELGGVQSLHFRLDVNGREAQGGFIGDMPYSIDALVAFISRYYTLKTGDLIYTGAASAPLPVAVDDHMEGYIEGRKVLEFNCK